MTMPLRKALLLDRDGVINVNHGYVYQQEKCDFVEGIFELCRAAQKKGYVIIIVTNQSGIARKYYSEAEFNTFTRWLETEFSRRGVRITHTYHCPHHPKFSGPCCCRKPKPGMLFRAQRDFKLSLKQSLMIGDSASDIACAKAAKVGRAVLLKHTGNGQTTSGVMTPKLGLERSGRFYKATSLSSVRSLL